MSSVPDSQTPPDSAPNADTPPKDQVPPKTGEETVPIHALHSARLENKELKKEVEALRAAEEERARKIAEEKGEHERLYREEAEKAKALLAEKESLEGEVSRLKDAAAARISGQLSTIADEADRELVKKLLDGKPLEEQESLLPSLMAKFTGKSPNANPAPNGGNKATEAEIERKKAIEENNPLSAVRHAPVVKEK